MANRLRRVGDDLVQVPKKPEDYAKWQRSTRNILISIAAFALLIAGVFAVLAGISYAEVYRYSSPQPLLADQLLPTSPYIFHVGGSSLPVAMTLPADLTPYIGKVFRVWSVSAQAHTLTILGTGSTFDGSSTVATFGGAIGDGLVFEVIKANRVAIISTNNIVFS